MILPQLINSTSLSESIDTRLSDGSLSRARRSISKVMGLLENCTERIKHGTTERLLVYFIFERYEKNKSFEMISTVFVYQFLTRP